MKVTVHTIAKDLNVAPSTISNALNNKGNISPKKREEIIAYCDKIGYIPSLTARELKTNKSFLIGLILIEETNVGVDNPYFSKIIQSFKAEVEKYGYSITFIVKKLGDKELSYLQWCKSKNVDGAFIIIADNDLHIKELVNSDIPCISCDLVLENAMSIVSDNKMGITQCLDHLFENQITEIGMILGPQHKEHLKTRFDTFIKIMNQNNIEVKKEHLIEADDFGYDNGCAAALELSKNPLPKALLVCTDLLAFGVIDTLSSLGYSVPGDVSVIGFDDIEICDYFKPRLTTIKQDTDVIGKTCAIHLIDKIQNKKENKKEIIYVKTKLIERETVKKTG